MRGDGSATLLLLDGRVITLAPGGRIAEAVAVRGDRIVAVGSTGDIAPLAAPAARVIRLEGRAVIPGLVDGHAHLDREGLKTLLPSLAGARSIDDVLQRIEALARDAEPGAWIVTMPLGDPPYYWDVPDNLRERRFPTRWELDRVSSRNPVYIRAIWGYWRHTLPLVSVANSEALRRAGVARDTVPPWEGIRIDKDPATGEPTGVFLEDTPMPLVELTLMAAAPRFTHADRVRGLEASLRSYHAAGTTSVFEGHGVADEVGRAYRALHERGTLTMRTHLVVSPSWGPGALAADWRPGLETVAGTWTGWLAGRGLGDAWLRVGGLYAELGPTPDNRVRARARPYTGWAGFHYDAGLPRERLRAVLIEAARSQVRVTGMTPDLLDLYAEVDREASIRDLRWVLGHVNVLAPEQVARIRDLGLMVTTHTNRYLFKEGDLLAERAGPGREADVVPLRRLRDAGVPVALATDNVPVSMFHPVWHAVARRARRSGRVIAPEQCLSREEALRAATVAGAHLTFEEDDKGTIEPGRLADLVVLSEDPLAVPEERLPEIVAELTVVGGRMVWESRPPAPAARGGSSRAAPVPTRPDATAGQEWRRITG